MDCPQKDAHKICGVVKAMSGIGIKPPTMFCRACAQTDTPETGEPNTVTATLGLSAIKQYAPEREHEYKAEWKKLLKKVIYRGSQGPGTELAKILHKLGVKGCSSCNKHAREMDNKGCDWCEQNEDVVVGWLRENAAKRRLPFVSFAAKRLIRYAIKRARASEDTRARGNGKI